jgi:hypothetical protein
MLLVVVNPLRGLLRVLLCVCACACVCPCVCVSVFFSSIVVGFIGYGVFLGFFVGLRREEEGEIGGGMVLSMYWCS